MRKMMMVLTLALVISTAGGASTVHCTNAWAGHCNSLPTAFTPQQLGAAGDMLSSNDKDKIKTDNGTWYEYEQDEDKNWNYILCTFERPAGDISADFLWETWVQGGSDNYVYNFKNSEWNALDENEGGKVAPGVYIITVDDGADRVIKKAVVR